MIGKKIVAWRGERTGHHGTVVRVDTPYFCFIRWDDGEVEHYESAAVTWEEYYIPLKHPAGQQESKR